MEALRQYGISVVGCALVCASVTALLPHGKTREGMKVLCGIVMSYALLQPLTDPDPARWKELPAWMDTTGAQAVALGQSLAREERLEGIKTRLEAYILDKARELGAEVEAEVTLDPEGRPQDVWIRGPLSPYCRQQLASFLTRELGIGKEDQQWTAQP